MVTLGVGQWIDLGDTGINNGWLTLGSEGDLWLVTGFDEPDPTCTYLFTSEETDTSGNPILTFDTQAGAPPETAPPPRPVNLPPVPQLGEPVLPPPNWTSTLLPDGSMVIKNQSGTITITFNPDGSTTIKTNSFELKIPAVPTPAPVPDPPPPQ